MTREEVISRLYDRYIRPTEDKKDSFIGVEIEMPIVNLNGEAVDFDTVHLLTAAFLREFDFTATSFDEEGHIYSAVNSENGDVFSYDCSYNNMEFSFGKEKNLYTIHDRFKTYYGFVQEFFKKFNYTLTGMGINPNRGVNHNLPIENGRYKMLFNHLSSFSKYFYIPMFFHRYPQFGMFSSASQVQLDVTRERLPEVVDTFNKLEPVKALIFSNSVLLGENEDLLCCRDMLWENSTHGVNQHNVGMYDCDINSVEDLLSYISTASIYCVEREGKYLNFPPVNILEYFTLDSLTGEYTENGKAYQMKFSPQPEDISYLRTFKFEDLTYRGTIEFRSSCCQPIGDVMTVAAFHLGLMDRTERLKKLIEADNSIYHNGYNAAELRHQLVHRDLPKYVDPDGVYDLARKVLELSFEGLAQRGQGEEKYLEPLFERVKNRTNPAKTMLDRLKNGEGIYSIVKSYAEA
ncbi:glutamylcysteine synthetase [Ruminococcus sp. JE7B6]|uniref:glutamylcysteine synthetase n=1 Tax=Ruminococcus sp. JE7B6 TaxID=3233380 RepID=UPI00389A0412